MLIYTSKRDCRVDQKIANAVENLKKTSLKSNTTFSYSSIVELCSLLNDCNSEDDQAHYITLIKSFLRSLEPNSLEIFYNSSKKVLLLIELLLKYSHHTDIMIKNTARISLMIIFQNRCAKIKEHITSVTIPKHINDIIFKLKQIILDIQNFYVKLNLVGMKNMHICYLEELEYIDDILKIDQNARERIIPMLLNDFIVPFIFTAIIYKKEHIKHDEISCRIGLFLLFQLWQTISDFKVKEYLTRVILWENEIIKETWTKTNKNKNKKDIHIINSFKLILLNPKTNIDTIYTLHILYLIEMYILQTSTKFLKYFYNKFLYTFLKLLTVKYHFNHSLECLKLKLLTSLCEPLLHEISNDSKRWLKQQTFFSKGLEIIYSDICLLLQHEINNIAVAIDEEYEIFINTDCEIKRTLDDANFLIDDNIPFRGNFAGTILQYFFHIRCLYLRKQNEKETVLPLMKNKEKIGKVMRIKDCIKCKKMIYYNIYDDNHFLKLTDNQLIILQTTENKEEGIVIFNSFYKCIDWSIHPNNIIKIWENFDNTEQNPNNSSRLAFVQLQFFDNIEDSHFLRNILYIAKQNQTKRLRKKMEKLFHLRK